MVKEVSIWCNEFLLLFELFLRKNLENTDSSRFLKKEIYIYIYIIFSVLVPISRVLENISKNLAKLSQFTLEKKDYPKFSLLFLLKMKKICPKKSLHSR